MRWEMLIDSREKPYFKGLAKRLKIPHRITALNADIVMRQMEPVKDLVGIERKRINDLVQSIQTGRIFKQIAKLKKNHEICFLMIAGDLEDFKYQMTKLKLHFNENVLWGTLASFVVRDNIQILWLPNDSHLLNCAYRIFTKIAEGKWQVERRLGTKGLTATQHLSQIPGVTIAIARRLLAKYGTLHGVAEQGEEELEKVAGIGPVTAQRIWNHFNR